MAYNGIRQHVLNKISKKVLRSGHVDFINESIFNAETEEVLEQDFEFDPPLQIRNWYYNTSTGLFEQGALVVQDPNPFEHTYTELKNLMTAKNLSIQNFIQYKLLSTDEYYIYFTENGNRHYCIINSTDNSSDVTDFETNYKTNANQAVAPRDSEGKPKINTKLVKGTLFAMFVYFTIGDDQSLEICDHLSDFWSINTSTGTSTGITEVSFKPPWSYDLVGGGFSVIGTKAETDAVLEFTMAPTIPSYATSFIHNKKIIKDNEQFFVEAPPKTIYYNPSYPGANECMLQISHGLSDSTKIELYLKIYKE